jgi:para-nitrobenzyl esterase
MRFEFAGTEWQLVEILSMDGASFKPGDRSQYTLTFAADGKMMLRADCNRGGGTWSSQGPSQLQFGPIATTRMKCSPESLSERYLAQFEWIRSYVTRDGHLFLATMADGAIIEFEPVTGP